MTPFHSPTLSDQEHFHHNLWAHLHENLLLPGTILKESYVFIFHEHQMVSSWGFRCKPHMCTEVPHTVHFYHMLHVLLVTILEPEPRLFCTFLIPALGSSNDNLRVSYSLKL